MGKPNDAIWEKFGACYMQGDARSITASDPLATNR